MVIMRVEYPYVLGTVGEIAKYILNDWISHNRRHRNMIHDCDFAIVDEQDECDKTLDEVYTNASGWYGIKVGDMGFSNCDVEIFSDYYGGGCSTYTALDKNMSAQECRNSIAKSILDTLNYRELCNVNTVLIANVTR